MKESNKDERVRGKKSKHEGTQREIAVGEFSLLQGKRALLGQALHTLIVCLWRFEFQLRQFQVTSLSITAYKSEGCHSRRATALTSSKPKGNLVSVCENCTNVHGLNWKKANINAGSRRVRYISYGMVCSKLILMPDCAVIINTGVLAQ